MTNYVVQTDPCEVCKTPSKELKYLDVSEKVANNGRYDVYSHHVICPNCETIYYDFGSDDKDRWGHIKRYRMDEKEKKEILKKIRYKEWVKIGQPKTEYGMYRKFGKSKMHNPFKGDVYRLIERAFELEKINDIVKLETIYPKEVENVRNFNV